jgi:nicotinic acid mononucleotide adenylyltransferase
LDHIELLVHAKAEIERRGVYHIIAGALAPANDDYVVSKQSGKLAIAARHRTAMCNEAVKGHEWLVPCSGTYHNAKERAMHLFSEVGIVSQEDAPTVLVLFGGDRFTHFDQKWTRPPEAPGLVSVVVFNTESREGNRQDQQFLQVLREKESLLDPDTFMFMERDTSSTAQASSTRVRKEFFEEGKSAGVHGMHPEVLEYMAMHTDSLC